MSEERRDGIIGLMTEVSKVVLQNYLRSYGLPVSGTKLELAMRLYDNAKVQTITVMMPPKGTISIGIALDIVCDHRRIASGGASVICVDCGEDMI